MLSKTSKPVSRWNATLHSAQQRANGMRRKVATTAATVLAVLMGYYVVFGHNGLTAYKHKRQDASQLRQQMEALDRENTRLRERVDHLQSDPGAIENEAREELHYTRAGEVIYTLPPDTPTTPAKH